MFFYIVILPFINFVNCFNNRVFTTDIDMTGINSLDSTDENIELNESSTVKMNLLNCTVENIESYELSTVIESKVDEPLLTYV